MPEVPKNNGLFIEAAPSALRDPLRDASKTVFRSGPNQILVNQESMGDMAAQANALANRVAAVSPELWSLFQQVSMRAHAVAVAIAKDGTEGTENAPLEVPALLAARAELWTALCAARDPALEKTAYVATTDAATIQI